MQTVLVTGSASGIGLEFCRYYQERNWHVIASCRSPSNELQELGVEVVSQVDVSLEEGRQKLRRTLGGRQLDVLINNAGLLRSNTLSHLNSEDIIDQFKVNALAPLQLTVDLLECLAPMSKVVMVSSRMGSIEDNTSGSVYGYRMSKAALNMAARSLSMDLASQQIAVGLFHPGYVQTKMTGGKGNLTTVESVQGMAKQIETLTPGTPLSFQHTDGQTLPW